MRTVHDGRADRRLAAISTVAYAALVGSIAALVLTNGIVGRGTPANAAQVAAIALMIWARITFGRRSFHFAATPTEGALVTSGPYRYVRNPIYAAALLAIGAGVATNWSLVNGALGALVLIAMLVRILCEESLLGARYPEFADYRAKTRRLIPFVL
jgi:protein-S-isoprenylcysteine O-methyltransferase Ste14